MITRAIQTCLRNAKESGWDKTFWAFDIHGTILKPTFKKGVVSTEFYPHAKEALQLISKREDVVMIIFTCSYPHEIDHYKTLFAENDIRFHYYNENPEVCTGAYGHYDRKFYFNVLFEDKAGFDPTEDWPEVLKLLKQL